MSYPDLKTLLNAGQQVRPSHPKAPEIWRFSWQGEELLLKSYHHSPALYQNSVGRLAISREWDALTRLADSQVAPAPKWRLSGCSMVMQWVEGTPLESLPTQHHRSAALLSSAEKLLKTLSDHRLAHADLGHDFWGRMGRPSNLLWTDDNRLVAIDFAGSLPLDRGPRPVKNLAWALQLHDELLLTKILYHFTDPALKEHPAWQLPSKRSMAWWDLMRALGKL